MTKVGEHVTLDIIGTTKEYDPSLFEDVINKIAKAAEVKVLKISKYIIRATRIYNFSFISGKSHELSYLSRKKYN